LTTHFIPNHPLPLLGKEGSPPLLLLGKTGSKEGVVTPLLDKEGQGVVTPLLDKEGQGVVELTVRKLI